MAHIVFWGTHSRPRPCGFTVSSEITGVTRRVGRFSYQMTRRVERLLNTSGIRTVSIVSDNGGEKGKNDGRGHHGLSKKPNLKKGHKKTQPKSGYLKGKCMHCTRGAEHPAPPGLARKQPLLAERWRLDLSRGRDTGGRVFGN